MPPEALRYPVTPLGLHYLLIHYDIPDVDADSFRLTVDGHVERPLELSLDDLRARPATELAVTMECAGNGRALQDPRPVSQPWLIEALGTAAWKGTPLAPLLAEAQPRAGGGGGGLGGAHPRGRGRRGAGVRPQSHPRRGSPRGNSARVRDERRAAPPSARLPAPS